MNVLIIGGLFLIVGAVFLARGNILGSTIGYFFADLCWLMNGLEHHDYFGSISIFIGIVVSLIVWWKMHKGIFRKSIKKEIK